MLNNMGFFGANGNGGRTVLNEGRVSKLRTVIEVVVLFGLMMIPVWVKILR